MMKRLAIAALLILLATSVFAQATVAVQPTAPVYEKLVLTNISISFAAKEKGAALVDQPTRISVAYQLYSDGASRYDSIELLDGDAVAFLRAFLSYSGSKPEGLISRKRGIDELIAKGKIAGVTADVP